MMKTIEMQGKTVDEAIQKALEQLEVSRDQVAVEIIEEGSRGLFGLGAKAAKVQVSIPGAVHEEILPPSQYKPAPPEKEEPAPSDKEHPDPEAKETEKPLKTESKPQVKEEKKPSKEPEKPVNKMKDKENVQQIVEKAKEALSVIMARLQIEYKVEVKLRDDQILLNIHCDNENFLIGRRGATLDAVQYLVNRIANKHAAEKIQVVLDTSDYRVKRKKRLQQLALKKSKQVKSTGKAVTIAPMNPHDRRIIHLTLQDDPAIKTLSRGNSFMRRVIISLNSKNSGGRSRRRK